jgi:hypothetical protein
MDRGLATNGAAAKSSNNGPLIRTWDLEERDESRPWLWRSVRYEAIGCSPGTMPNPRLCFSLPKSFRCRYGLSLTVLVIAGKLAGDARCNTQYFATMTRR